MGCTSHPEVRFVSLIDPGLILYSLQKKKFKQFVKKKKIPSKNFATNQLSKVIL